MHALLEGLVQVLAWPAFGYLLAGVLVGSAVALLPGISSIAGLVLLLPFVLEVNDPTTGIALLLGAHAVMTTGDSIFAILFNIPGHAGAQALVMDGYPMTLRGKAGAALGASFTASGLGGLIGAVAFLVAIPLVLPITKAFGTPEFLVLALWGISMVGLLSGDNRVKGLATGALGLWLGTIGLDPQQGVPRYALGGQPVLLDGLSLVAVSLGLFAVPQAMELIQRKTLIDPAALESRPPTTLRYGEVREGVTATLRHWYLVVRSSVMGVFFGIIPGIGGSIIDWLVYGQTVAGARDRSRFGRGDVRGVIGPESAENSKEGGQLVPTVAFGVPGGSGMAVILSALLTLGVAPGVTMVTTRLPLTMSMVWVLVIANIIASVGFLFLTPLLARVTGLSAGLLVAIIVTFCLVGTYLDNTQTSDLLVLMVFAVIGNVFKSRGWPRPPLLLGFVLAPVMERYLFISYNAFGWSWIGHPGVLILAALIAASLVVTIVRSPKRARVVVPETDAVAGEPAPKRRPFAADVAMSGCLVALAVLAAAAALDWPWQVRLVPTVTAGAFGLLAVVILVQAVFARRHGPAAMVGPDPAREQARAGTTLPVGSPADPAVANPAPDGATERPAGNPDEPPSATATARRLLVSTQGAAWFVGLVVLVLVAGMRVGLPVGVFLLCKVAFRESWRATVLTVAGVVLLLWGFTQLFSIFWPTPLIQGGSIS